MAVIEVAIYVIGFIALSGLMAMVDAAVLSVSRGEIEEMVMRKYSGAVALRSIAQRIGQALVIIVLFTNTINILGPILAGKKAADTWGDASIGVITAILTFGTIIFSEIIPKSLGTHYAPKIARVSAPIILSLIYVLYPIVRALEWMSNLLKSGERPIGTEAQIRSIVSLGREAGHIEEDEGQLIHRAFILNDKTAANIMTPLRNLVGVEAKATISEAATRLAAEDFSRYPVFGKSMHEVVGMVLIRDVLAAINENRGDEQVESILRQPFVVPHDVHSDRLLVLFRDKHIHMAVVQQAGKTVGLVTFEDVLEELVGEIEDEMDVEERSGG